MSLGSHVSKQSKILNGKYGTRKTMLQAIQNEADLFDSTAMQIFTHGPRSTANNMKNADENQEIKDYITQKNIKLYVHSSYVSIAIWKITAANKNEDGNKKYIEHIDDQLDACRQIGALGLVVHLPRKKPEVIVQVMKILNTELKNKDIPILLEMVAQRAHATTSYESPEKLNNLSKLISANETNPADNLQWGYCIDTSHLFAAGLSFEKYADVHKWFDKLDKITTDKILLFHLNGSTQVHFGEGKDLHIIPLSNDENDKDAIWGSFMPTQHIKKLEKLSELDATDMIDMKTHKFKSVKIDNAKYDNIADILSKEEFNNLEKSGIYRIMEFAVKHEIGIICEINRGRLIENRICNDILMRLLDDAKNKTGGDDLSKLGFEKDDILIKDFKVLI